MFEFRRNQKDTFSIDNHFDECPLLHYPQSDEPFRCIDIYSSKAIARLLLLCGYTPLNVHFSMCVDRDSHFDIVPERTYFKSTFAIHFKSLKIYRFSLLVFDMTKNKRSDRHVSG